MWRQLRKLGEDVSEVLDYIPASFIVIRHVRPKLSCCGCDAIVQAPGAVPSHRARSGRAGTARARSDREVLRSCP